MDASIFQKEQGETDSDEDEEASGSESSEESSDEEEVKEQKAKGVGGLIECENPNRVVSKPKKVTTINTAASTGSTGGSSGGSSGAAKPQLSRRER